DHLAAVENVVADQAIEEGAGALAEFLRLGFQLRQRLFQAVRDLDVAAAQLAAELVIVVADDAQRLPRRDHVHDQAQHVRSARPAVHQVADEERPASPQMPPDVFHRDVAELSQERGQLIETAVDVADEVEWATAGWAVD